MDKILAKLGEARDFPGGPVVKIPPSNTVGAGLIPGWGTKAPHAAGCGQKVKKKTKKTNWERLVQVGNGTPLQYSCLENPMDGGAWWAAVHGVAKSRTRLSDFTFMHWRRKWQPTPVFLPGEPQGQRSLLGCRLWGRTESDMTEAT